MDQLSPEQKLLASRIEDQLIDKFNNECCGNTDIEKLSEEDMLRIFNKWIMFWANERTIYKKYHIAANIKKHYCTLKLLRIYEFAERRGFMDKLPDINI